MSTMNDLQIDPRDVNLFIVLDAVLSTGSKRRVVVAVPQFFLAPFVVAQTDLLLMAPERMANLLAPAFQLELLRPPIEVEGFTMCQVWHERVHHDAAHTWFRKLIASASRADSLELAV